MTRSPGVSTPLLEHWDGGAWSTLVQSGLVGSLQGVAGVSADDAWAVGDFPHSPATDYGPAAFSGPRTGDAMLIEHWDGHVWAPLPFVHDGELNAVAAAGANDVWAVGGYYQSAVKTYAGVIFHWDGVGWRLVLKTANYLNDVAVVGRRDVWAVGDDIVVHWDGKHWRTVPVPQRVGASVSPPSLASVTAFSAKSVWAVGAADQAEPEDFDQQPAVIEWNGKRWIDHSPRAGHLQNSVIADIAHGCTGLDLAHLGRAQRLAPRPARRLEPRLAARPGLERVLPGTRAAARTIRDGCEPDDLGGRREHIRHLARSRRLRLLRSHGAADHALRVLSDW